MINKDLWINRCVVSIILKIISSMSVVLKKTRYPVAGYPPDIRHTADIRLFCYVWIPRVKQFKFHLQFVDLTSQSHETSFSEQKTNLRVRKSSVREFRNRYLQHSTKCFKIIARSSDKIGGQR